VSLGLLALPVAGAVLAMLLDGDRPKAMRAGLSAATYLAGLLGWGMARGREAAARRVPLVRRSGLAAGARADRCLISTRSFGRPA
jgi:hypothetical protein